MSIGLHCRVIGRPGRSPSLDRFIGYAKGFDGVWFATREEIARSWLGAHAGDARSAAARSLLAGSGSRRPTICERKSANHPAAFITVEGIGLCQAARGGAVSKSAA